MKKSILSIGFVIAGLVASGAFAQSKGEAEPPEKAPKTTRPTAAEKAAGKEARKSKGTAQSKADLKYDESRQGAITGKPASKDERLAAKTARRAAAADAVKKGEISSGEK